MAVGVLQSTGQLTQMAGLLNSTFESEKVVLGLIGIISAVVDNVPIVAAAMGMYDLQTYPTDAKLWEFLAYCAGTGGSILLIAALYRDIGSGSKVREARGFYCPIWKA